MVDLLRGNELRARAAYQRLDELETYYLSVKDIPLRQRNRILGEICIIRKFTVFNYIDESTELNDRIISLLDGDQSYLMHRENEFTFGSPHLLYMYFREAGKMKHTTKLIIEKFPVYPKYADGCGTGSEYLALGEYALETGDWVNAAINTVTVKTHLQNIYRKLEVRGKQAAINTARQNGLIKSSKRSEA
jgi:LuxR family maltose regulon positive regulatory protein